MLTRTATAAGAAALLLGYATALATPAVAADGPGADPDCGTSVVVVTVCASDNASQPGNTDAAPADTGTDSSGGGGGGTPKCTYTKLEPQPPDTNLAVQDGKEQGPGAAYQVLCPGTGRIGVVWILDGEPAPVVPAVDPEVLAAQAVDSMKLTGPKVASPRSAGAYVVGMPTWMWVEPTETTYGPATATATAGAVTVTATAEVTSIRWDMGDGQAPVICHGPGTRYQASLGKTESPDCGHLYQHASTSEPSHRYTMTATSTWTITWQAQGAITDAGQWTETRTSTQTIAIGEAQALTS